MPKKRWVEEDERAEILAEARRIVGSRDEAALAPNATLASLSEILADTFDLSYTAERVVDMLRPERWRTLKRRLSQRRAVAGESEDEDGIEIRLPADVVAQLKAIDEQPLAAIRALLAGGQILSERGSEEYCQRRRCAPEILLSNPGSWSCQTCGLTGRTDLPVNEVVRGRLVDQKVRTADLHALATGIYEVSEEAWGAGGRFTAADCVAQRLLGGQAERDRYKHLLPELVEAGLIEEAPGPRGGTGYRVLDEAPDWLADVIAERRQQREAETRVRYEQAAAVRRALEDGLTYTTSKGMVVDITQSERGLELHFPAIPQWELRDLLKRQGHCRWDGQRRRWCRSSPVASVEPWLAAALEEGATVAPYGSAEPDADDWASSDWPD